MFKKMKGQKSVRPVYRQQFLSGFEHPAQSDNENSNRKTFPRLTDASPQVSKGQRSYNVSVEFVIETISDDSGEHVYRVLLNDDPNISVAPYSIRGKKETGQAVNLPKTGVKGGTSFSMVYGIHKSGKRALSHTQQHKIQFVAPLLYSFLLGAIDRAIECTILEPGKEQTNDDTNKRDEITPTQENLGTDKKKGRRKKIRSEILPEALPETSAVLVALDGQVLGRGFVNEEDRLRELGSGADNGGAIATALSNGQTPDVGF